jgi:hypothetical protein
MSDLRERARAFGLDRLTDEHLAQFERAATNMKRHIERLPKNLTVADEPAHIYQAKEREA